VTKTGLDWDMFTSLEVIIDELDMLDDFISNFLVSSRVFACMVVVSTA
jgi:hypothetical protein